MKKRLLLCELIIRWPRLQQRKRARHDTIRNFLKAKGGRAMALTEQRVASIDKDHLPLLEDHNPLRRSEIFAGTRSATLALTEAIKSLSHVSGREADIQLQNRCLFFCAKVLYPFPVAYRFRCNDFLF